jgi:hypothetical protein
VRIFAYDRFKPGVTLETIEPYLPEEVANVWRLWKAGGRTRDDPPDPRRAPDRRAADRVLPLDP